MRSAPWSIHDQGVIGDGVADEKLVPEPAFTPILLFHYYLYYDREYAVYRVGVPSEGVRTVHRCSKVYAVNYIA